MKLQIMANLVLACLVTTAWAGKPTLISGDYVEVRTCNVYVGGCVANGEMGLTGKEGILVWSIREGSWNGTRLDGMKIIAVIHAEDTLSDQRYKPAGAKAVLILDTRADAEQQKALADLALSASGKLIAQVVEIKTAAVSVDVENLSGTICASVRATGLVDISTLGLAANKAPCGNETLFYPPLTDISDANAGFTARAAYSGSGLNRTWECAGLSSAYVGKFSR